jgi:F-type H+-transporting ATPase subunit c
MDKMGWLSLASIVTAGMTIAIGSIAPAIGEGKVAAAALDAIARQPDQRGTITRTLFVCLAMVESTAIYCLVISLILLFANPLLETVVK